MAKRHKGREKLEKSATQMAKNAMVQAMTGKSYGELSISEKERLEKMFAKRNIDFKKRGKKYLGLVKQKERERLAALRAKAAPETPPETTAA